MTIRRFMALGLSALLALTGCGSDSDSADLQAPIKTLARGLTPAALRAPSLVGLPTATALAMRAKLQAAGQPVYLVINSGQKFEGLMTPIGQNRDVTTWASPSGEQISLRDSLLVASGGFGPDLMSSTGPTLDRVRSGQGTTTRSYYYLDGADQRKTFDFTCTLAEGGAETITVLGRGYETRKVTESCTHPLGNFQNVYWFDSRLILRQSIQVVTLGMDSLFIQRVID